MTLIQPIQHASIALKFSGNDPLAIIRLWEKCTFQKQGDIVTVTGWSKSRTKAGSGTQKVYHATVTGPEHSRRIKITKPDGTEKGDFELGEQDLVRSGFVTYDTEAGQKPKRLGVPVNRAKALVQRVINQIINAPES